MPIDNSKPAMWILKLFIEVYKIQSEDCTSPQGRG